VFRGRFDPWLGADPSPSVVVELAVLSGFFPGDFGGLSSFSPALAAAAAAASRFAPVVGVFFVTSFR
jgi:hypothetical protein